MGGEWARRCVRECMDVVIWLIVAKRRTERASEHSISVCEFTLPSSRSSARPDFLPTILGDLELRFGVGGGRRLDRLVSSGGCLQVQWMAKYGVSLWEVQCEAECSEGDFAGNSSSLRRSVATVNGS